MRIDTMHEADVVDVGRFATDLTEGRLKEELARPWARLRVARGPEERPLAFMLTWLVADEVHVLDIVVEPAQRRRGIARALMLDALDDARARHAVHMYLEVRRSNASAIALYRALGFHATNVRSGYYSDGEDAVDMALSLDPVSGEVVPAQDDVNLGPT